MKQLGSPSDLNHRAREEIYLLVKELPIDDQVKIVETISRMNGVFPKVVQRLVEHKSSEVLKYLKPDLGNSGDLGHQFLRGTARDAARFKKPIHFKDDVPRVLMMTVAELSVVVVALLASESTYAHAAEHAKLPAPTSDFWVQDYPMILMTGALGARAVFSYLLLRPLLESHFGRTYYPTMLQAMRAVTTHIPVRVLLEQGLNFLVAYLMMQTHTPEELREPNERLAILSVAVMLAVLAGYCLTGVAEVFSRAIQTKREEERLMKESTAFPRLPPRGVAGQAFWGVVASVESTWKTATSVFRCCQRRRHVPKLPDNEFLVYNAHE